MLILTGSRASGKTYNLLRECNNNNGVVLVKGEPDVRNMKEYAESLGFKNVRVESFSQYNKDRVKISPVYIESLDDLFKAMSWGKVAAVTTNTAEVISLNPYRVIEDDESKASAVFKSFKALKEEN